MATIHETPPGEEGDDSVNAPDDLEPVVSEDELGETDELDDEDDDEPDA